MADLTLVIGNKQFSSWSLRPWIALKQIGLPFREVLVRLRRPETKAEILNYSPSGKVPYLIDGALGIWDSLAILEYLNELKPEAELWPADRSARAVARAVSAEMHSGFAALRQHLGMDLKREPARGEWPSEAAADIERVQSIWAECRGRFGGHGPFLFGKFTAADAMYAPVVTRFHRYGVPLDPRLAAYRDAVLALPAMREWTEAAQREP
ncbi:MAG TPA: glutathione S-transferase family protein [Alphaproteobacteria bacterium]|nr:glutathione S-transferase family protein [Alphaproteobacteria bacterium]